MVDILEFKVYIPQIRLKRIGDFPKVLNSISLFVSNLTVGSPHSLFCGHLTYYSPALTSSSNQITLPRGLLPPYRPALSPFLPAFCLCFVWGLYQHWEGQSD